jgi:hypothetical protein
VARTKLREYWIARFHTPDHAIEHRRIMNAFVEMASFQQSSTCDLIEFDELSDLRLKRLGSTDGASKGTVAVTPPWHIAWGGSIATLIRGPCRPSGTGIKHRVLSMPATSASKTASHCVKILLLA